MNQEELLRLIEQATKEHWTELDLSRQDIEVLPSEIGQLEALATLILWDNHLSSLPLEIAELRQLSTLDLGNNRFTSLPPVLTRLTTLKRLDLDSNQLTAIPSDIAQLNNLGQLDLYRNQLTMLPSELTELSNLTWLNLEHNQLTALPSKIGRLTNLSTLELRDNRLDRLPSELRKLQKLKRFDIRENPLRIPPEIAAYVGSPVTILSYYFTHVETPSRPLNEVKVLVVGQGGVGKTSLVRRLLDGDFDLHEDKTQGISIRHWVRELDGESVLLNIWDFGGQEIMHSTHRFFMTHRSVYVLVLAGREEHRLEYWLGLIDSFGGNSPIVIVVNKSDQDTLDLPERALKRRYPTIRSIVPTSCKTGEKIDLLQNVLDLIVLGLPNRKDPIAENWFVVKQHLEDLAKKCNYLSYSDYLALCRQEKINDRDNQKTLIRYLHDLGVVLHFEDSQLPLHETMVLNPEWVTRGVYRVLNYERLRKKDHGRLHIDTLKELLDPEEYPEDRYHFIIRMMERFELCYPLYNAVGWYIIPDLLPVDEPNVARDFPEELHFQYRYKSLPSTIVTRLIVRLHRYTVETWRSGAILRFEDNDALIRANENERCLEIRVCGDAHNRRGLLTIIRAALEDIHADLPGMQPEPRVPIPGHPDIEPISYDWLKKLERDRKYTFSVVGLDEDLDVRRLLNGVDPDPAEPLPPIHLTINGGDAYVVRDIINSTVAIGRGASAHRE